ncbi:hypothetical protein [Sphingobium sp.]|uniref:hypothetical protein n=1 Tax=Sphingobium sp. TaxID=1912891 RepID=UPI003B3AF9DF
MLLRMIERFLQDNQMSPTRFGRECARDPRLVLDLRRGRQPGDRVKRRVEHFVNNYRRSISR